MTLETNETPPIEFSALIQWHTKRMNTFFDKARQCARQADQLRADYRAAVGTRRDARDIEAANWSASRNFAYKDLVSDQQMYDRWAMRESAMIVALTAARHAIAEHHQYS